MFDFGFSEMLIVAIVALVVLGPDRLPKVARQAGEWLGKMRRYVDDVKADINRQMELEELRKLKTDLTDAAKTIETSVQSTVSEAQTQFDQISGALESTSSTTPNTDWDKIYAVRRTRDRIKDRRREREKDLGMKRPRRPLHR